MPSVSSFTALSFSARMRATSTVTGTRTEVFSQLRTRLAEVSRRSPSEISKVSTGVASVTGATVTDTDPSHYLGVSPGIDIEKATNGQDADSVATITAMEALQKEIALLKQQVQAPPEAVEWRVRFERSEAELKKCQDAATTIATLEVRVWCVRTVCALCAYCVRA